MPSIKNYFPLLVGAALIIFAAAGCSSTNNRSLINPDTGKHAGNWYTAHRAAFLADQSLCVECHGTDLHGGMSGVSCFSAAFNGLTCHANGPSGHPAGWSDPTSHGIAAKAAPDPASTSGFSICQTCHGANFNGGFTNTRCSSCHGGSAPHPTSWITGTYTHENTNPANAAVCALCHTNGANSPIAPPSPQAAAGTAPGCFNGTLCHTSVHTAGWENPASHGAAAKAAPNPATTSGFSTCQSCHGTTFQGGSANTACSSCHGGSAPHPTSWLPDSTYSHTSTNQANASVCVLCHANGANSPISPPSPPAPAGTTPGCFNGSLCHYNPG